MAKKTSIETLEHFAKTFSAAKTDVEMQHAWSEYLKWQRAENRRLALLYPLDPPNKECHTAVISGLLLSNGAGFQVGTLTPYFVFASERVSVWTHAENEYSQLVATVPHNSPAPTQPQKTLASCLEIACSFRKGCEVMCDFSYHWMYRFDPALPLDKQEHYEIDGVLAPAIVKVGLVEDLSFLADSASVLDLLLRDDRFFIASQHFLTSIRNHWFCIECELGPNPNKEHPSHEPTLWQAIQVSPSLDIAMVQACRAVEALVGKPGHNQERTRQRWRSSLQLDPDLTFARTNTTFIDYFREMYAGRNDAAHSRGKIPFKVVRRRVIDAQCFAWQLLGDYADKNAHDPERAQRLLHFNLPLLDREVRGYTTKMTDRRFAAIRFKEAMQQ